MKNFFLSCKELRIETTAPKTYYGAFYLGPFENGQALTVANALRRTLLSEISSLGITSAKIEGASNEYMSLEGVRETVLDILLNLKEIALTKTSKFSKTQFAYLQARGPGIVRAKDLLLPPSVQSVDPEQYIATLSEDGKLNLTVTIDEGILSAQPKNWGSGINQRIEMKSPDFRLKEVPNQTKSNSLENFLEIDAVFTPVKKVNYTIEPYGAQSIQKANQVILLEVWTNGSVTPKEALSQTLNYLRMLFDQLGQLKVLQSLATTYSLSQNRQSRKIFKKFKSDIDIADFPYQTSKHLNFSVPLTEERLIPEIEQALETRYKVEIQQQIQNRWESRHINDLGLPFRIFNVLHKAQILTVGDILKRTPDEISQLPGLGKQSLQNLRQKLELKGILLENWS